MSCFCRQKKTYVINKGKDISSTNGAIKSKSSVNKVDENNTTQSTNPGINEENNTIPIEDTPRIPVEGTRTIPVEGTKTIPVEGTRTIPVEDAKETSTTDTNKRRSGLGGQAVNVENVKTVPLPCNPKEEKDEKLLKEAFTKNEFLKNLLEGKRMNAVINAMYIREVKAKEIIIKEGSYGNQLYISADGVYQISKEGKTISSFSDNRVFGELAILYNDKRRATIKALQPGHIWVLERVVYQQLLCRTEIEHHEALFQFLTDVPIINNLSEEILSRIADLLKKEFFSTDSAIVKQGDVGDKFYIISAGTVSVTKEGEGEVSKMGRGEFFGQLALLKDDVRQATVTAEPPGVECFSLSRPDFIKYIGPLDDDLLKLPQRKPSSPIINPYTDIQLTDLTIVSTLGVGGFGRVELCQHSQQKQLTFALKYLKKIDMLNQQQEVHAFNEKSIQMKCDTIFIVRLYKTFHDSRYLYFLMEVCLGGDLWSLLQKQEGRKFKEVHARFYAASVLEAFAYLHERNIVYRDLKPENLLLDTNGFLKLTDFGFAKKLGQRGKTYTFAGTPEYVAPEIVLNRGHDKAADYWTLGIFIFELLVGKTPFRTYDTSYMRTFNLILKGIESITFPQVVERKAENIIKKLCRNIAVERLGCQKEGAQAIRDHKWFLGFDWEQLRAGQMKAPFKRPINNNTDTKHFDKFEKDTDIPPDELSELFKDF